MTAIAGEQVTALTTKPSQTRLSSAVTADEMTSRIREALERRRTNSASTQAIRHQRGEHARTARQCRKRPRPEVAGRRPASAIGSALDLGSTTSSLATIMPR